MFYFRHFWSYTFFVSLSLTPTPPPPPPSWVSFGACCSRVWLEGDAPGRCKSGKGCWHRGNSRGRQMKSPSPSLRGLLLKVHRALCVCEECIRSRACKTCQKCPRTKMSPGWVLPLWLVGGGRAVERRGGLLVDYNSSVWVLFHFCQPLSALEFVIFDCDFLKWMLHFQHTVRWFGILLILNTVGLF